MGSLQLNTQKKRAVWRLIVTLPVFLCGYCLPQEERGRSLQGIGESLFKGGNQFSRFLKIRIQPMKLF